MRDYRARTLRASDHGSAAHVLWKWNTCATHFNAHSRAAKPTTMSSTLAPLHSAPRSGFFELDVRRFMAASRAYFSLDLDSPEGGNEDAAERRAVLTT